MDRRPEPSLTQNSIRRLARAMTPSWPSTETCATGDDGATWRWNQRRWRSRATRRRCLRAASCAVTAIRDHVLVVMAVARKRRRDRLMEGTLRAGPFRSSRASRRDAFRHVCIACHLHFHFCGTLPGHEHCLLHWNRLQKFPGSQRVNASPPKCGRAPPARPQAAPTSAQYRRHCWHPRGSCHDRW
jgi:hypothetical protein